MRVAVLMTGGKDSALTLHRVLSQGYEVEYLATMIPQREDSWMFHYPNINLVDLFAEAAGIPLMKADTSGIKEEEVKDLEGLIGRLDVEAVAFGAIASKYQKTRIEGICKKLKLKSLTPLWDEDPTKILNDILDLAFDVIVTGVYAHGFSREWLGRKIDKETVEVLLELKRKYGISPVGEGGEYETLVLDAPFLKKKIKIMKAKKIWEKQGGYLLVTEAKLEDK